MTHAAGRVPSRPAVVFLLAALATAAAGKPPALLLDVALEAGLDFVHENGARGSFHLPEIMGSGAALFDYDQDGDLDVLLVQGGDLTGGPGASAGAHQLFRNDGTRAGVPRFTNVSDRAGLRGIAYGMGVAVGDYDNDGYPDLYLTAFGRNQLFRNLRDGRFADVTASAGAGLDDPRWSTSASFADYDADGDLDLYVSNYVDFTLAGPKVCQDPAGARDYCGPLQFRPLPDRLFRNEGNGTFTDVSQAAGITRAFGAGLGVIAADLTGDGRIDFYVANDASANQLWVNRGDGRFEDAALEAGVAVSMDGQPEGSMGIAAGDVDGDGELDLFVTNVAGETHAFYQGLGDGQFDDRRVAAGLGPATAGRTGFGTEWFDYDHDGRLDLFIANGAVARRETVRGDSQPYAQRNQLFRGLDDGRFSDVSGQAGPDLDRPAVGRGAAFGDVDGDGDTDVLVTINNGRPQLLLNAVGGARPWVRVRLQGVADNRAGLGARVGFRHPDGTITWRHVHTDGSYLSGSEPVAHLGLGERGRVEAIIVHWPHGGSEEWPAARAGLTTTLRQGTGRHVKSSR